MHTVGVTRGAPSDSRIERKKRQTRERLYDAAEALIAAHGYDATTMEHIAAEADTARGTAFNHFPSKRDFVLEWAARRRRRADAVAVPLAQKGRSTAEQLRAYFHELATVSIEQFQLTRNMLLAWVRAGGLVEDEQWLAEELVSFLERGRARGDIRSTVHAGECASLLYDIYIGLILRWIQHPDGPTFDFAATLDDRIEVLLHGLIGQSGGAHA